MRIRDHFFLLTMAISAMTLIVADASAQHKLFRFTEAPGRLAHKRLIAEPGIANYDQPVSVILDDGGEVAYWDGAGFAPYDSVGMVLGMRVGPIFQLKVSSVIRGQLKEVYPTVEMLDRLYPPTGYETQHPVNIVLSQSDIEEASSGQLITKIIYLENPDTALPTALTATQQPTVDVGRGDDPFTTADRLGRPMAIVRIGSRMPMLNSPNLEMPYESPVQMFVAAPPVNDLSNMNMANIDGCFPTVDCCPKFTCCEEEVACLPKARRDEYVCDGHDRELPVVVSKSTQEIRGLDLEDTVATFEQPDGKVKVAPSNRVCIYSPRFAAVRRVLSTNNETITQKLNIVNEKTQINTAIKKETSSFAAQNVQLQSNKLTQMPNQFVDRTRGVLADNVVKLSKARLSFKPFEDLGLIRFGKFDSSETTRISLGMQSAIAWESRLSAQIAIDNEQPVTVNDTYQVQEMISIESDTDADLRLCKLASTISAKSGETVDFTIRFDNIGRNIIRKVTIVDNLSPRLEFIEGTAECSVEAEFRTEANEGGSMLLKWDLVEPLKLREGGIIRFQCRVR